MGYWHKTCAISHLPIEQGDPVVAVLIAQNPEWNPDQPMKMCSNQDSFWIPLGMPIRAEYNDFGWITEVRETDTARMTLEYLKKSIIEREPDVQRSKLDGPWANLWETIGKWIHGDRLQIHNLLNPNRLISAVNVMMIHARLFDEMSKDGPIYDGTTKTWRDLDPLTQDSGLNLIIHPREYLQGAGLNEPARDEFTNEIYGLLQFHSAMASLRRHYGPMTGEGSQTTAYAWHEKILALTKSIIEEAKLDEAEQDEEDEEFAKLNDLMVNLLHSLQTGRQA